ncbi:hypothetical protein JG687_00017511 [Phytophthora cactorum]|uniref:Uncharacterized protein n=1 Tax=Phytophthora cactorum TaxID=29920 RepID=A0A329RFU4_9STRA|nr:hypothetical protein JG687_00017511 [Phytophthora cactorum]RAW22148.1 hypothetical protein PC110_g21410 [Phytophthora cactorum]
MYVDSRKGWLNREDGAEQEEQHYLTNHLVEVLSDESLEHNWDSPSWSEKEILTIRRKMLCDCKGFFETRISDRVARLICRESQDGSGAKNITGVIRPSEERDEKYFWVVEFDHGAVPDAELDIKELAEILNYTYRAKYDFIVDMVFKHHGMPLDIQ